MSALTITEALAEIKTITSRIEKKRQSVTTYFYRDSQMKDPHAADGGSQQFIKRERQAINDLEDRMVKLRSLIQKSNLETSLSINTKNRTVAEWLNWRKEVSARQKQFLQQLTATLNNARQNAIRSGKTLTDKEEESGKGDVIVNINEQELAKEVEDMETTLGVLDGKLSLLNATTMINI
jgi:hypothetical protein